MRFSRNITQRSFFELWAMWQLLNMVFNIIGVLLLIRFFFEKWTNYHSMSDKMAFWTFRQHKYVITVGGFLLSSLLLIELVLPNHALLDFERSWTSVNSVIGILVAASISILWAVYLRRLDVFDPERWINVFLVFLLGSVTVWLVFPISNALNDLGFKLNGEVFNDLLYCIVGIGMVEEWVKLLPLLIIVRFKKVVREPYDFLLYASISALGFAFIENTLFILKSNFYSINGRALMATVAHMTFSSVIGYGLMITTYKRTRGAWLYLFGAFFLSSAMHGFYDFWLINPLAKRFDGLTLLFFLLTTHFWFTMKNKTINASRFFDPHRKLINDKLRYFLIFWLTALLMTSVLLVGLFHGRSMANDYLRGQLLAFGFLLYYLSFSFSRFKIVPRMLNAGQKAFDAVIPTEPMTDQKTWGAE